MSLPETAHAGVCLGLGLTSCSTVGTATLTGGALSMVSPATLTWTGSITGAQQTIYDTLGTDEAIDVLDLRGLLNSSTGSGWNVTATATTFTGATTGKTIADTTGGQVLAFGGGGTSATASKTPSDVCVITGNCTAATDSVTGYPLFIPTGASATPVKIYDAATGTGSGITQIGTSTAATGTYPAVWSVTLPASIAVDSYVSTITMTVASGP